MNSRLASLTALLVLVPGLALAATCPNVTKNNTTAPKDWFIEKNKTGDKEKRLTFCKAHYGFDGYMRCIYGTSCGNADGQYILISSTTLRHPPDKANWANNKCTASVDKCVFSH
ncbi:MAG: hypothetical protein CMF50_09330 [Legionellales bacterium]|nr:hypothetical protein [Legionellales bacterium]|tara:strand:+ start:3437 stop:3778 length:342 start_codon:yes stop_codon:yes gene_type:complete